MPFLLVTFTITTLLIAVVTVGIQILKTRKVLKRNLSRKTLVPSSIKSVIQELNLDGRIDIVKNNGRFSFCYGLLRPKVCLSTGLLKAIDKDELRAVLLHESSHVKNRDPLKIILGKTASYIFFFIPIIYELQKYYLFSKEITADETAVKSGLRRQLAAALSKVLVIDSEKLSGVAALMNPDNMENRILHLSGKQVKTTFRPTFLSVLLSILAVIFSLVIINTPVYANYSSAICKADREVNYSKQLLYTPANATPK